MDKYVGWLTPASAITDDMKTFEARLKKNRAWGHCLTRIACNHLVLNCLRREFRVSKGR